MSHRDGRAEFSPDERIDNAEGTFDIPGPGEGTKESGTAGLPPPDAVPQDTIEEIEAERAARLDPANRPDSAEVDNTHRHFDSGSGMFTDNPDYDPAKRPFAGPDDPAPEPDR